MNRKMVGHEISARVTNSAAKMSQIDSGFSGGRFCGSSLMPSPVRAGVITGKEKRIWPIDSRMRREHLPKHDNEQHCQDSTRNPQEDLGSPSHAVILAADPTVVFFRIRPHPHYVVSAFETRFESVSHGSSNGWPRQRPRDPHGESTEHTDCRASKYESRVAGTQQTKCDANHEAHCDVEADGGGCSLARLAPFVAHAIIPGGGASAIHVAAYNSFRIHSTIRCIPAMAAGVIDRSWSDLFDAVTRHSAEVAAKAKRDRRIQRLIDRLQRGQ